MLLNVSTLPDEYLVRQVNEDACSESFTELSKRHSNLCYKILQNYVKVLASFGYDPTDIFEEKDLILLGAINKFNVEKGNKFSTWLGNFTRYTCLNKINKVKGMPELGSASEMEAAFEAKSVEYYESAEAPVDVEAIFKSLENTKDTRITNIFKLRYDPELSKKRTWAQIADKLELTVQTTIQLHKKGLKLLREEITNKKLDVYQDTY
jgi:RNA polymerase sigma factor (sigma-70 family)